MPHFNFLFFFLLQNKLDSSREIHLIYEIQRLNPLPMSGSSTLGMMWMNSDQTDGEKSEEISVVHCLREDNEKLYKIRIQNPRFPFNSTLSSSSLCYVHVVGLSLSLPDHWQRLRIGIHPDVVAIYRRISKLHEYIFSSCLHNTHTHTNPKSSVPLFP